MDDELEDSEIDASNDKQGDFYSKAQWFVDLYDEDYAVDQWGNEWEGETY